MNKAEKLVTDLVTSIKENAETQHNLASQVDRMADALYRTLCVVESLQSRVETLEKQIKSNPEIGEEGNENH